MKVNVKEVTVLQLERLRRKRGWSQAQLARTAQLNQSTVCSIEKGHLFPYQIQLVKLAKALGVNEAEAAGLMEVAKGDD